MSLNGFSVITITKRLDFSDILISNFLRQFFVNKELIIIINNDLIDISTFNKYTHFHKNIYVYKLPQNTSLGECLNYAINKTHYNLISKFDDDDYYGPFYLFEAFDTFSDKKCDIVGKTKTFMYFEDSNDLRLKDKDVENQYSKSVLGSTICFKKQIFKNVKFRDINVCEDMYFNRECLKKGYNIYSCSRYNYIIFKHSDINKHTFKSDIKFLKNKSKSIKNNIPFENCFVLVNK